MSMFDIILCAVILASIVLVFTKLKHLRWWKKLGVVFCGVVFYGLLFFLYVAYFAPPQLTTVTNLILHYSPNATDVKVISTASDKTKSDSFIVIASYMDDGRPAMITMPVTRLDGFDNGWHADSAHIEHRGSDTNDPN